MSSAKAARWITPSKSGEAHSAGGWLTGALDRSGKQSQQQSGIRRIAVFAPTGAKERTPAGADAPVRLPDGRETRRIFRPAEKNTAESFKLGLDRKDGLWYTVSTSAIGFVNCAQTRLIRGRLKFSVKREVPSMRVKITLACSECKQRNYNTMKNKKNDPDRLEMNKYCRFCRKHTLHKETK